MTAERHFSDSELRRFVAATLPGPRAAAVARHLLTGCRRCKRVTAESWRQGSPASPAALEEVFGRVVSTAAARRADVERERLEAARLMAELEPLPFPHQLLLLMNSERFENWFLAEALLEKSHAAGFSEPARAVRLAEAAVALTQRMAERRTEDLATIDLAARAWSILGNARRVQSDFGPARDAFARALDLLSRGSGDPQEEATILARYGLLEHAERNFEAALSRFDAALRLSRMVGDRHLEGRVLTHKARTLGERGDPAVMIRLLRKALGLVDPEREPRLVLVVQHNLTWALKESGRLDEALSLLQEILPLHARSGEAIDLLRLRWLEGKLAQAQGELGRAETAFREVREGFLGHQVAFDAALVSLDLAAVLHQQGRLAVMKRLAAESLPVFRTLGIHREALAALALFQAAVEREAVSLRWIGELAAYLQSARNDPALIFQPST